MKTAIDWERHPEPWRSLGPSLKAEVERICAGGPTASELLRQRIHNIKQRRQQRGWSQRQLAERAGCQTKQVWAIESGNGSPSTAAWRNVERVLDGDGG